MTASFFDYLGWVSLSANLQNSFEKALRLAGKRGHQVVRAEHLMHAVVDDAEGAIELARQKIHRDDLRGELKNRISEFSSLSTMTGENGLDLRPDRDLKRLMARASDRADQARKELIDGGDVVRALLDLDGNHTSRILLTARDNPKPVTRILDPAGDAAKAALLDGGISKRIDRMKKKSNRKKGKSKKHWKKLYRDAIAGHEHARDDETPAEVVIVKQVERSRRKKNKDLPFTAVKVDQKSVTSGSNDPDAVGLAALPAPEIEEIRSSFNAVMAKRRVAEEILNTCEWYHLLKNLNRVDDELNNQESRHKAQLVKKAETEIAKRARCRKAWAYVRFIDEEIAKMKALHTAEWEFGDFDDDLPEAHLGRHERVEIVTAGDQQHHSEVTTVSGSNYRSRRQKTILPEASFQHDSGRHVWKDASISAGDEIFSVSGSNYSRASKKSTAKRPEGNSLGSNQNSRTAPPPVQPASPEFSHGETNRLDESSLVSGIRSNSSGDSRQSRQERLDPRSLVEIVSD